MPTPSYEPIEILHDKGVMFGIIRVQGHARTEIGYFNHQEDRDMVLVLLGHPVGKRARRLADKLMSSATEKHDRVLALLLAHFTGPDRSYILETMRKNDIE